jgi:hypothetical protein
MPTIQELRERTPKGYNLAMEVPLDYDMSQACDDFMTDKACLVLEEAEGNLGVLRAMDLPGRRKGIQKSMALDGKVHKILHLRFFKDKEGSAIIDAFEFKLHSEEGDTNESKQS